MFRQAVPLWHRVHCTYKCMTRLLDNRFNRAISIRRLSCVFYFTHGIHWCLLCTILCTLMTGECVCDSIVVRTRLSSDTNPNACIASDQRHRLLLLFFASSLHRIFHSRSYLVCASSVSWFDGNLVAICCHDHEQSHWIEAAATKCAKCQNKQVCTRCTLYKSKYNTMELTVNFLESEILKMSKKNFKFMMLLLVGWHLADGKENPETLITFWRCGTYDSVICLFCAIELRMSRMGPLNTVTAIHTSARKRFSALWAAIDLFEWKRKWMKQKKCVQNNEWIVLYSMCAYL